MSRVLTAVALAFLIASPCYAEKVRVIETHTIEYEDGKIVDQSDGQWEMRYEIDEGRGIVVRTESRYIGKMKGREKEYLSENIEYAISGIDSTSVLLRNPQKKGQKIITAVGTPTATETEMVVFGEDFYLYCKTAYGRLYIASGKVEKAR